MATDIHIYINILALTCAYPCTEVSGPDHGETLSLCCQTAAAATAAGTTAAAATAAAAAATYHVKFVSPTWRWGLSVHIIAGKIPFDALCT